MYERILNEIQILRTYGVEPTKLIIPPELLEYTNIMIGGDNNIKIGDCKLEIEIQDNLRCDFMLK